jgi:hypothetical protein
MDLRSGVAKTKMERKRPATRSRGRGLIGPKPQQFITMLTMIVHGSESYNDSTRFCYLPLLSSVWKHKEKIERGILSPGKKKGLRA